MEENEQVEDGSVVDYEMERALMRMQMATLATSLKNGTRCLEIGMSLAEFLIYQSNVLNQLVKLYKEGEKNDAQSSNRTESKDDGVESLEDRAAFDSGCGH